MLRSNVPRGIRYLRRRRGWRQVDLAVRAGMSGPTVSRVERGALRVLSVGAVERLAAALGASVDLTLRWEGEQLDRLIDAAHAWLENHVAGRLTQDGWLVRVEVSFNHYGDRGRVDVLAFHPATRIILVVEVKSGIGDVQEALGRLDVKTRLGRQLADAAGWAGGREVVPALVVADKRPARRVLATHGALFSRFELRGRSALAWMRRPSNPSPAGLLWFAKVPDLHAMTVTRGRRVRTVPTDR